MDKLTDIFGCAASGFAGAVLGLTAGGIAFVATNAPNDEMGTFIAAGILAGVVISGILVRMAPI